MIVTPLVSTITMTISAIYSYKSFINLTYSNTISTLLAIAVGCVVYCIMLFALGGVRESDFEVIPGIGSKLAKLLAKLHLLRR